MSRHTVPRIAPLFLAAIAIAALGAYAHFVWTRAINVPFHDDVIDVLDFLLRFESAGAAVDRLQLLFVQYNDHRTAASRIIYLVLLKAQGHLDFRSLVALANFSIPVIAVLHAASSARGVRLAALTLALLVLCQPRGRDFLVWGMSVLAFQGTVVYGLAALVALQRPSMLRFLMAGLASAAAMCSLSSGQLIWLAGCAQLAYAYRRNEPQAGRWLLAWIPVSLLALLLFHAGFLNRNPSERLLGFVLSTPLHHFQYFLVLLGSALSFENLRAGLAVGAGLMVALPWIVVRALRQGQVVQAFFIAYLSLSIAVLALGRAPYSNLQYAMDPRYSVFSVNLLVCVSVIALAATVSWDRHRAMLFAAALSFFISSYYVFTPLADVALKGRRAAYNGGNFWVFSYPIDHTNRIVGEAVRQGFYRPPPRPLPLLPAGGRSG
jgi:hypothetical protein